MNDNPKNDECVRCGDTPTECTDGEGERLCAEHGRIEHVRGGMPSWDDDAPQEAQLLGACALGGPDHDDHAFEYCPHGRPVCHRHTAFHGGQHDPEECGAAGLAQDELPLYFRAGSGPDSPLDDEHTRYGEPLPESHDTLRDQREPA